MAISINSLDNSEGNSVSLLHFILYKALVHFANKLIDLVLSVSMVTTLNKVRGNLAEATPWRAELHGPQEVVGFLKVLTHWVDLVDEILNADDTTLAQLLLNDCIVSDGNTLFVDLSMATLVDQLSHTLQIWVPKNQNKLLLFCNTSRTTLGSTHALAG